MSDMKASPNFWLIKSCAALVCLMAPMYVTGQSDLSQLIASLSSTDWMVRANAVNQLATSPVYLASTQVQQALVSTLTKENALIVQTLRDSNGSEGVEGEYGDDYPAYYTQLLDAVTSFGIDDLATLQVLAAGSYNSDSAFAKLLATHVDLIATTLVNLTGSDVATVRQATVVYLGEILNTLKPPGLTGTIQSQFTRALVNKAADDDPGVKKESLKALTALGDLNADGKVDCVDIAIIKASFGKKTGQAGFDIRADVNSDGVVDIRDLAYVSQRLPTGTHCQ